jgi:hypothetical protein
MNHSFHDFVGEWKTDQRPASAAPEDGDVTIGFKDDGTAEYSIYYTDRRDVVHLSFSVEGDELLTTQGQSAPLRTKFSFERDGSLLLWFSGVKGRFIRRHRS